MKIDPVQYADKWVMIEFDITQMSFYAGECYQRFPKALADNLNTPVTRLKFAADGFGTEADPKK